MRRSRRQKADCDRVPNTARAVTRTGEIHASELSPPSCFPVGVTASAHCNFEKLVSYFRGKFLFCAPSADFQQREGGVVMDACWKGIL
mmetsp:Transcript_722/g.1975  ORF Transcript_722/g.1975 Transcript_722/m.1975 type:complete len:88 (-) Transcript_722:345-608(-)